MYFSHLLKRISFPVRVVLLLILAGGLFAGVPTHAATTTSLELVSNAADPTADNLITYTVFLTCDDARPTGTVTFFADMWQLPRVEIVDGVASITLAFDSGDHEISAVYAGDSSCAAGRATVHEAVGGGAFLSSSPNPSSVGQLVTFDVLLAGCGGNSATFYDNGIPFASQTVDPSHPVHAIVQTSTLTAGIHQIQVISGSCLPAIIPQVVLGSGTTVTWCNLSGDGRLNSTCSDRIAVYCNTQDVPPNVDVWVIDNSGQGHELTTIPLPTLSQVPSGTYAKALGANGVVYAGIDANGSGYVALQGGPYNGTALGDWAKTFTCKATT